MIHTWLDAFELTRSGWKYTAPSAFDQSHGLYKKMCPPSWLDLKTRQRLK